MQLAAATTYHTYPDNFGTLGRILSFPTVECDTRLGSRATRQAAWIALTFG